MLNSEQFYQIEKGAIGKEMLEKEGGNPVLYMSE